MPKVVTTTMIAVARIIMLHMPMIMMKG